MQSELGVEEIKILLAAARLAGPALGKDPLLVFEALLPETIDRRPPGSAVVQMVRRVEVA